jgi:hypothetical protein
MSDTPGTKSKAAPGVKRREQDREVALHAYLLEHHPDYADWLRRRNEHRRELWKTAERRYPQKPAPEDMLSNRRLHVKRVLENAAMGRRKKGWFNRHAREWDKAHPTTVTWEKRKELEAEFAKRYVPIDRS